VPKEEWNDNVEVKIDDYHTLMRFSTRCNVDFAFFAKYVLNLTMENFHKEPLDYVYRNRFILVIWPRGHYKTTIWSEAYPIWRLWRENNIEIGLVSSALSQSEKTLENVQMRIEQNEFLKDLVPRERSVTWNKSQLNTKNNRCFIMPFNSSARGKHLDYLIMDDILREENLSQEQIKDYFWSIFFPEIQTRKGQLLLAGTPMTTKDLFAELQNPPEEFHKILTETGLDCKLIKRACVTMDDSGKWLEPIMSSRFNLKELEAIKASQGALRFEREYMCNPLGGGATLFKNIRIGTHSELHRPIPNEDYYMGVDVAMMVGDKRDWLVFSILGKDKHTGMIKQRKMERYQGKGEDEIIQRLRELHSIFKFKKVMVENVGLTTGLVKDISNQIKYPELSRVLAGSSLKKKGFVTNKRGKEDIVSAIIVAFDTNQLEILDNTLQYNELIAFKAKEDPRSGRTTYEGVGEHDDMVIALGLALLAIQSEEKGRVSITIV
jgi:hypothetical protein